MLMLATGVPGFVYTYGPITVLPLKFTALTITATAIDTDGAISQVEFFNGPTKLGDGIPVAGQSGAFSFQLLTGLPTGRYTFTAKATDDQGTTTASAPVTVNVTAVMLAVVVP